MINYIETIFSNLPNSIYWKDYNGVYLGANMHAVRMVGLNSIKDLLGKTDYDFTSKDKADQFRKNDLMVLNTGQELCVEELSISKEGTELIQLSTKKPIKDDAGHIVGIMGVTVDITDLKTKEKMLWDQKKSLEAALSAKKKFFNSLSHEIRTPIHIINSIADELYKNSAHLSKEEFKSFLGILLQNSNKLNKLVLNLLEIAKSNRGEDYYCFEKKNVLDTIRQTINEFATIAKISFDSEYEEIICNIDTLKIGQVIRNLLDNAVKYGNSKHIVLKLSKSKTEQIVTIKIKNKGINILKEEQEEIFEPFFRGSNGQNRSEGTGLGLAICKEIIMAHKGKIWIDNKKLGTIIINFTLPYVKL